MKTISAGHLLSIETGEYSNFLVMGFFVALKDIDFDSQLAEYLKQFPEQSEPYRGSHYQFLAWLIAQGALLEIDYTSVDIGSYGTLRIS